MYFLRHSWKLTSRYTSAFFFFVNHFLSYMMMEDVTAPRLFAGFYITATGLDC